MALPDSAIRTRSTRIDLGAGARADSEPTIDAGAEGVETGGKEEGEQGYQQGSKIKVNEIATGEEIGGVGEGGDREGGGGRGGPSSEVPVSESPLFETDGE